jgi:hypothetical protein
VTTAELVKLLWDVAPWLVPPFLLVVGLHTGYWVSGREFRELREDRDHERLKREEAETALMELEHQRRQPRSRS